MTGKTVFIKTYGCQMNVYDSERMADTLTPLGYVATDRPEGADLVILNTCHIREKAAEKVFSELGRLKRLKAERKAAGADMLIAVAGCVAQAEGAEIIRRQDAVDVVVGPQSYHHLPELIARAEGHGSAGVVETDFPIDTKFDHLAPPSDKAISARGITAFLTVQEGCDKFCTFCVVPYTRGSESSRPVAAVLEEARRLADGGVREITLLGQNVNAYHGAEDGRTVDLAGLLERLAEVPDIERLRFTTSHPRDMNDALIDALATNAKLMPYLHLPVQAGSDRILKAMNRGHTAADYLALVDRIRAARPDIALSGDLIVGFPGESDEDFEATMDVVRRVGYAACYSFKYSPRPGTPAAERPDQVPEAVKGERLARLQALLDAQQAAFAEGLVGKTMPVLFEKAGRHRGQLIGRSPYLQPVNVMAPSHLLGQMAEVIVESCATHSLNGRLADPGRPA